MTNKEQIIIDGVDVSGCVFYQIKANKLHPKAQYCGSKRNIFCEDEPNCYFKQLARKTQECEELRVAYNKAQDIIGRVNGANELKSYSLQESIKECDRYRKALEEIEEYTIKQFCENCDDFNTTEYNSHCEYCEYYEYFDIINKAKDGG